MAQKDKITLEEWQSVQSSMTEAKINCLNGHCFDIDLRSLQVVFSQPSQACLVCQHRQLTLPNQATFCCYVCNCEY